MHPYAFVLSSFSNSSRLSSPFHGGSACLRARRENACRARHLHKQSSTWNGDSASRFTVDIRAGYNYKKITVEQIVGSNPETIIECLQCSTNTKSKIDADDKTALSDLTTYNSYLIKAGGQVALIDTAPEKYAETTYKYLSDVPNTIDLLIVQHTDSHHIGLISKLMNDKTIKEVVATAAAFKAMENSKFNIIFPAPGMKKTIIDVPTGPRQFGSQSGYSLKYIPIPNLHTSDTMITVLETPAFKMLFTCDAYATHSYSAILSSDYGTNDDLKTFYRGVLTSAGLGNSGAITTLRAKVTEELTSKKPASRLVIAPGHGPCWKNKAQNAIDQYKILFDSDRLPANFKLFVGSDFESNIIFYRQLADDIEIGVRAYEPNARVGVVDLKTAAVEDIPDLVSRSAGIIVATPPEGPEAMAALDVLLGAVDSTNYVSLVQISDSTSVSSGRPRDYLDLFLKTGATIVSSPVQVERPTITRDVVAQLSTLGSKLARSALREVIFAIFTDSNYEFSDQLVAAIKSGVREKTQELDLKTATAEQIQILVFQSAGIVVTTPPVSREATAALGVVLAAVTPEKDVSLVQISASTDMPRDYAKLFRATGATVVSSVEIASPTITPVVIGQLKDLGSNLAKSALRKVVFGIFIDSDAEFGDQLVDAIHTGVVEEAGIKEDTETLNLRTANAVAIQDLVARSAGIVVTTTPVGQEAMAALGVVLVAVTPGKYVSLLQISDSASASTDLPRDYSELFRATGATIVSSPVQVIGPTITQTDIDQLKTLGSNLAKSALSNVISISSA